MLDTTISPVFWSVDELVLFGDDAIYDLAICAAGTKTSNNLLLGRCLLAVERTRLYERLAKSGAVHFAITDLGLSEKEAHTVLRVARQLQSLPILTRAAEQGTVAWSKLREVVRVASPETEELWLELCARMRYRQIEKLVGLTPKGGIPGDCPEDFAGPHGEEYRCRFSPEVVTVIEGVLRQRSEVQGRPLTFAEAVEQLFSEALVGKPYDETEDKLREEARLELLAEQLAREPLVQWARELAEEIGLLTLDEPNVLEPDGKSLEGEPSVTSSERAELDEELPQIRGSSRAGQTLGPSIWPTRREKADGEGNEQPELGGERDEQPEVEGEDAIGARKGWHANTCGSATDEEQLFELLVSHLRFHAEQQHLTPAQRKALLRRDRYCCRTPGCPHRMWLHFHHVKWYCVGGKTLPENLIALCTRCHRNVHQGRLRITRAAGGELLFIAGHRCNEVQRGRRLDTAQLIERAAWLDYNLGWRGDQLDSHHFRILQAIGLCSRTAAEMNREAS